jgi:CheY-like chemotaxis protein
LRDQGYNVLEASNAPRAVGIVELGYQVDLVFTDIQMPGGMDGIVLAAYLKANHPAIKIVLTSGHARAYDLPQDFSPFIDKPYERGKVVEHIRRALEN